MELFPKPDFLRYSISNVSALDVVLECPAGVLSIMVATTAEVIIIIIVIVIVVITITARSNGRMELDMEYLVYASSSLAFEAVQLK